MKRKKMNAAQRALYDTAHTRKGGMMVYSHNSKEGERFGATFALPGPAVSFDPLRGGVIDFSNVKVKSMESNCLYSTLTDRILEISENPERMRNTYVGCHFHEGPGIPTSEGTYICDVDDLYDAISQVKGYNARIKRGRLRWFIKEVIKNREEIVIMGWTEYMQAFSSALSFV